MPVGEAQWGKRVENERKRREGKKEEMRKIGYEFDAALKDVPARKALEGKVLEQEERTVVTTREGDGGTMVVVSEEVTKKVVKRGRAKNKVADEGNDGKGETMAEKRKTDEEVVQKVKKARKNVK